MRAPVRRGCAWAAGIALAISAISMTTPASAAAPRSAEVSAERPAQCHTDAAHSTAGSARGSLTRPDDHADLSHEQMREVERALDGAAASDGSSLRAAGASIPVHVHVIDGRTYRGPSKAAVHQQLDILDDAFAGRQSPQASASGFDFFLASFERVRNQRWLTAGVDQWGQPDADSREMRKQLHVGNRSALNLYLSKPDQGLLGYSSWPFQGALEQDGVTVHSESMTGGNKSGYNQGDTAVHEVGHWLGLYHTFEGGCGRTNDGVADTPREAHPSYRCPTRDTCTAPGLDPVHNFMDYSFDSCMDRFTAGQAARMAESWQVYRAN